MSRFNPLSPLSLIAALHILLLPPREVFAPLFISSSLGVLFGLMQVFCYRGRDIRDSKQEGCAVYVFREVENDTLWALKGAHLSHRFHVYAKRREIQGAQGSAVIKAEHLKE